MPAAVRPRPPVLRALGRRDPPEFIEILGQGFVRVEIYKHDSWAATARYRGPAGDVVCKFNRIQPCAGIPLSWVGRRFASRERRMFARLAGVAGIPADPGPVHVDGRPVRTASAHAFVPGRPLGTADRPSDQFFPDLLNLLEEIHLRRIAYVDLHKRENILRGSDGRPYLVDFQVSVGVWRPWLWALPPARSLLRALQHLDVYCLAKHLYRLRPDQAALLAGRADAHRPWWINVHRAVGVPLRSLRRGLLVAIRVRAPGGRVESEAFAEDAFRPDPTDCPPPP